MPQATDIGTIYEPNRMSAAQLCKVFGVSRQAVLLWPKSGCPRNADKTFSLTAVIAWHEARAIEQAEAQFTPSEDDTNPDVRRWQAARADLKELELQRTRGELVSVALVESQVGEAYDMTRTSIMGLAQTLPPRLDGLDAGRMSVEIEGHCRETLEELRQRLEDVANEDEEEAA